MSQYDDIIHLPRPVSARHAPMPIADRAAQFAPFAALTGYDATIRETARLTDDTIELDEGGKALLNEKLQQILAVIHTQPFVTVTYFCPDERKSGGAYVRVSGKVRKIDPYAQTLMFEDRMAIPIDSIYEIEADIL